MTAPDTQQTDLFIRYCWWFMREIVPTLTLHGDDPATVDVKLLQSKLWDVYRVAATHEGVVK